MTGHSVTDEHVDIYLEYANKYDYLSDLVNTRNCGIADVTELRRYVRQALSGIQYCHENGIIHSDLKIENLLVHESDGSSNLLLCDFGLSQREDPTIGGYVMHELSGSGGYIAPECKEGKVVTKAIDIWSFGICLYQMAVGYKPQAIDRRFMKKGVVPFDDKDWESFDKSLKELVSWCLEVDPSKRPTASDALEHPWLQE